MCLVSKESSQQAISASYLEVEKWMHLATYTKLLSAYDSINNNSALAIHTVCCSIYILLVW